MSRFLNRAHAGMVLAHRMRPLRHRANVLTLALSPGGVRVATEVARGLHGGLDILYTGTIESPENPGRSFGAVVADGTSCVDAAALRDPGMGAEDLAEAMARAVATLQDAERSARGDRPAVYASGCCVILVDDGITSVMPARAAIRAMREQHAARVILAVPVITAVARDELAHDVDELVCVASPEHLRHASEWYYDFSVPESGETAKILGAACATYADLFPFTGAAVPLHSAPFPRARPSC